MTDSSDSSGEAGVWVVYGHHDGVYPITVLPDGDALGRWLQEHGEGYEHVRFLPFGERW